mgnify:CR=1 FL=1
MTSVTIFRPLAGIRGFGSEKRVEVPVEADCVSVPLRGLEVLGDWWNDQAKKVWFFVSVPLRGLEVLGAFGPMSGENISPFVSVPLRGLEVLGEKDGVFPSFLKKSFRPLAGIRGFGSVGTGD